MKKTLKSLTWSDFPKPCYDPQKRYGDFSGTILDILHDERIPVVDRIWAMTRDGILDERTLLLFACKCVRSTPLAHEQVLWDLLDDPRSREAVDVVERFANRKATRAELGAAQAAALSVWHTADMGDMAKLNAVWAAWNTTWGEAAEVADAAADAAAAAAAAAAMAATRNVAREEARHSATEAQVQFAIELIKANYKSCSN